MLRRAWRLRFFSTEITAAVARGPQKPFTFEKLTLGDPRGDEVLVKLVATGICHTDVHTKVNGFCKFPAVLGHEGAGIIEHVGSSVQGLAKGDHVVMSYASCGGCASCHSGKPSYCVSHGDLNFSQHRLDGTKCVDKLDNEAVFSNFFQQSSFATHAVTNQRNVVKIDRDLPLALMAPLGCAVQTGAGAVLNSFEARPGSSIVIFGCGGVGLSAVAAAKIAGCSRILAVDINPERLRIASELGATNTIVASADVVSAIKEATKQEGVNFALDTSGKKEALLAGVEALAPMGVCAFVAPGQTVEIPTMSLLMGKQFRGVIQGDSVPQVFIPQLTAFWRQGKLPLEKFVTMYPGLSSINRAVEEMKTKTIKPIICLE